MNELRINRSADTPFTRLASSTWLAVTDDYAVPDDLGDTPEVFYRLGMIGAFQLISSAASDPNGEQAREVVAGMEDALDALGAMKP